MTRNGPVLRPHRPFARRSWLIAGVALLLIATGIGTYLGLTPTSGPSASRATARTGPGVTSATVTGYATISASPISADGQVTGPVTVVLRGATAARLFTATKRLTSFPAGPPCELTQPLYQVIFATSAGRVTASGSTCGPGVEIQAAHGQQTFWTDPGRVLLTAVRQALPASAVATQHDS